MHIAGCAENRPECISGQENDRHCAENRPKCVSRHEPTGARRARTGRGFLYAFWDTAGQAGGIVLAARRAARGGPGRRRREAEIGLPDNTLCPIFSTTPPFRLPENTLWPFFSTFPRSRRSPERGASDPGAAPAAGASIHAAPVVKTRVHWRVESRKTRLRGQNRPSLEANPVQRPRFSVGGTSAPVAPAEKPQFRRPYQQTWSKPAFSVPTVKAGFDHGGADPRGRGALMGRPRARPHPAYARRSNAAATCGQPHETCTNRRRSEHGRNSAEPRGHGEASTRQPGGLWRFRKANPQVGEPWAAGSMNINVHRPLTAAFPQVGSLLRPSRRARAGSRASRPRKTLRRRKPSPPAGSFDCGRFAPFAQDDKSFDCGRPQARYAQDDERTGARPRPGRPPRGRPQAVKSFDSGGFAACAQDDRKTGARPRRGRAQAGRRACRPGNAVAAAGVRYR